MEAELREILDKQLDETRVLRGAAMARHGESYLDRAQRVAELESEMKMMRFIRDMPKHERNKKDYMHDLQREMDQITGAYTGKGEEELETHRERLEDLFAYGPGAGDAL